MDPSPNIARVGALLGDNTRARMLSTLMHGKALTANELAVSSGVTAQTATTHLAKLIAGELLVVRKQGRHKYFSLASPAVADLLENLMGLAAQTADVSIRTGPRDAAMRKARVCYNHLAGEMGIHLYDSLIKHKHLRLSAGTLQLTRPGTRFVGEFGIDVAQLSVSRSPMCRECLDWSERRSHLAGSLGRALMSRLEELRWVRRDSHSRIVTFTKPGEQAFVEHFRI